MWPWVIHNIIPCILIMNLSDILLIKGSCGATQYSNRHLSNHAIPFVFYGFWVTFLVCNLLWFGERWSFYCWLLFEIVLMLYVLFFFLALHFTLMRALVPVPQPLCSMRKLICACNTFWRFFITFTNLVTSRIAVPCCWDYTGNYFSNYLFHCEIDVL